VRNRIFCKLLAACVLVIATATATLDFSIRQTLESSLRQEIERNLRQKTVMFANRVNTDRKHDLKDVVSQEGQAAGARATVIDPQGTVLADSEALPSTTGDHARTPEFAAALRGEIGSDVRQSHTVGVPFLYVAAPVEGGAVRLAYPLSDVQAAISRVRRTLAIGSLLALAVALIISGAVAAFTARRLERIMQFAKSLAEGDLGAHISENSGDEIGQLAASLDRTARHLEESFDAMKNSQRELETLLNSMQDAVITVGGDDRVQWSNQAMNRLVPQQTRLSAPVVETVRDPDFLRAVRAASVERTPATARATSILPGRTFDVTAGPLPGGGAVAVLRDLTEAERVEKTRRDFIANVSHELRTPLTSIQGYTETLLDSAPENNHSREFLDIIRKNATRMSRLTEDLLTLARVESGEQQFSIQPVAPGELLHEVLQSFRELARTLNVELQVEDNANAQIAADPEAIHQVFSNLVENALKYGAAGGRVVLGARPALRGVEFYVKDFGPGIASEHLPRLFERFYRVDKARSQESGGTGLGLAIAKHIVLAHQGSIRAESELNHGSTFLFVLPASQPRTT
jgi:two-component system, OmpR family, phosphate regulon sensor histidine kinase PhoR